MRILKSNKKLQLIFYLVFLVLIAGLIVLNVFAKVNFPSWLLLIPTVFLILHVIINIRCSDKTGSVIKVIAYVATFIITVISLFTAFCFPYWNSTSWDNLKQISSEIRIMSYKDAESDLNYTMRILKKTHPAFRKATPKEMEKAYNIALENLKADEEITSVDFERELSRFLGTMSDGHTNTFGIYNDDKYLKDYAKRLSEGFAISAIDGVPAKKIIEENLPYTSYEFESWGKLQIISKLSSVSGLQFLGFNPENIIFTWEDENGNREDVTYTADDFVSIEDYWKYNEKYRDNSNSSEFVSYKIDKEKSLAFLTLKECNYNKYYCDTLEKMFTEIKSEHIENIAVDVRGNGGGSSMVVNEFIRYLDIDEFNVGSYSWRLGIFEPVFGGNVKNNRIDHLTFKGNVYILSDTSSFSSAMMFPMYIQDNNLGKIIGEAPGNNPNGYGETAIFHLKNSELYISVSTKHFLRADPGKGDVVEPDFPCDSNEAYDKLIEIINKNK